MTLSTIKDVARLAGVTIGTVSNYINGKSVKDINARKIEKAIKETGFSLDPIARSLKTRKSNTVGIVVPDITSPYSCALVKYVEKRLHASGYHTIICDSWNDKNLEKQKIDLIFQRKVDGIVLYPCGSSLEHLRDYIKNDLPIVVMDTVIPGFNRDHILTDNFQALYDATKYVIEKNHKRIALINGSLNYYTSSERYRGHVRAISDLGLELNNEYIHNKEYSINHGYEAAKKLMHMENPPTAIITCNFETTQGAIQAINEMELKMPEQIALVGFDDIEMFSLIKPSITVMGQPLKELGENAAEILLETINGEVDRLPKTIILPAFIIERDSV